ncbi:hypothetical protein MTO96_019629 [Rhipicephalus appendiculatus]
MSPRSYGVKTEDGRVFRRNRRHLLQTREQWAADVSDDDGGLSDDDGGSSETRSADCGASAPTNSVDATPRQSDPDPQVGSADGVPVPATPHHGPAPPRLTLVPRRSGRTTKPPQRLRYDAAFNQID